MKIFITYKNLDLEVDLDYDKVSDCVELNEILYEDTDIYHVFEAFGSSYISELEQLLLELVREKFVKIL